MREYILKLPFVDCNLDEPEASPTTLGQSRGLTMIFNQKALIVAAGLFAFTASHALATGAIAVDDQPGAKPSDAGYGIGFGDSKDSAKQAALRKCKDAGNDSCKVMVWFEKCGAYASSFEKYGIGWGDSKDDAEAKALDVCGNDHCKVVTSECDD